MSLVIWDGMESKEHCDEPWTFIRCMEVLGQMGDMDMDIKKDTV